VSWKSQRDFSGDLSPVKPGLRRGLRPRNLFKIPEGTEAIEKASVSRKTFYQWLRQPEFKAELDRQRDETAKAAFDTLTSALTKAVENLVGLIDNADDRLKRLACKDIIEYILEHKAIEDLDKRLAAIEQKLSKTN
jgi:hypothetical protein